MPTRYPIRALKFIVYFFILAFLVYLLVYYMSGAHNAQDPSLHWRNLFSIRTGLILGLLGLAYPFFGFNTVSIDLPRKDGVVPPINDRDLQQAVEICGFKMVEQHEGRMRFVYSGVLRRALAMFEDQVILERVDNGTLQLSGLRRDVARIRLKVGDYLRYV